MKSRLFWASITALVLLTGTSSVVSAKSADPGDGAFTEVDKEFYLTEAELSFIRPGLVLEIIDTGIPADLQPEVTFKITDPAGLPLDREGIFTPGPVSTSFILSFIPAGEEAYVAYTTRVATAPDTGATAVQATTDSGGTYTDMGPLTGTYMYKFATVLPADYDMNATHTTGMYARRDLREFDLDRYVENELDHFIPSGEGVAEPRSIVTTETCNARCHDPLAIHGGSRQEVGLCILCHNPTQSQDPDTGDWVDMPYMTHKIHRGFFLENGYTIVGYRQSVHDYSNVVFPAEINDCEICHTGGTPTDDFPMVANPSPAPTCDASTLSMTGLTWGDEGLTQVRVNSTDGGLLASTGGAGSAMTGKWVTDGTDFLLVDTESGDVIQTLPVYNTVFGCANNPPGIFAGEAAEDHTVWMTEPTRWVCGSCHDNINWETGENHAGGPQDDDEKCAICHEADSGEEFDRSVAGAHTPEYKSNQLGGVLVEIIDIANTAPGDQVKVTFSLNSKWGPLNPADLDRLRFSLSGPNEDFDFYVQETVGGNARLVEGNWEYTFNAKLPMDAMGSFSLGTEGRADAVLETSGDPIETEDQMQNFIESFAVTDTLAVDRDQIVDDAKCEACHSNLSLHGSNRTDANGYCQTCHMPGATDAAVRPEGTGEAESIHFKYMIHKIHRGEELENGYIVYGYRSSLHDFSDYIFSGDLRNCEACHVDDRYTLPLPDGRLDTPSSPTSILEPLMPETSSCLSCHDSDSAAVHADSNSTDLGEACATCHGTGKTYSVERVHAR
jgi:hypothetical protein